MEDDLILKSYKICQRHEDYLNSINQSNHSIAIRSCIDRLISLDKQKNNRQKLDRLRDNILIISIGMIFLLFGIVSSNLLTIILATSIGLFFAAYGLITIKIGKI